MTNPVEPEQVREMFGAIAPRYDLANHVLSCGLDFVWRNRVTDLAEEACPRAILDLATGTGDLALLLQKRIPSAQITAADFSAEMLSLAKKKGVRLTTLADARQLPFAAENFDVVTIAFGLRNLPDWSEGLREMQRVIRRGGMLLVLDFSLPQFGALRAAYRLYLHRIVPLIGGILTGKGDAYSYLGDSIERFPHGETMLQLLREVGFRTAEAEPLSGGIVTIYRATR